MDWANDKEMVASVLSNIDESNPQKRIYSLFQAWNGMQDDKNPERVVDFQRQCEAGLQSLLHQWTLLPPLVSASHIPLLYNMQQYVEFQEACAILSNLASTTAGNVELKSTELKGILAIWRDRLPNFWDDVDIWSDLVAWRQHVFGIFGVIQGL